MREALWPAPLGSFAARACAGGTNPPEPEWSPTARSTSASGPGPIEKALKEGEAAADAYLEGIAPDLVVEAEITSADAGKAERYGEMGVRELWRLHGRQGTQELRVEFFALSTSNTPRALDASEVLEGLTPDDVCEAVEGVRFSLTDEESRDAVARVVRRRQRTSVRVREERRRTRLSRMTRSGMGRFPETMVSWFDKLDMKQGEGVMPCELVRLNPAFQHTVNQKGASP